jgi:hypothetical protein
MDFDWADELIHTYYGKKWLEHFIQEKKLGLTPLDVKKNAEAALGAGQARATEAMRQRADELRIKTLTRARELALKREKRSPEPPRLTLKRRNS